MDYMDKAKDLYNFMQVEIWESEDETDFDWI